MSPASDACPAFLAWYKALQNFSRSRNSCRTRALSCLSSPASLRASRHESCSWRTTDSREVTAQHAISGTITVDGTVTDLSPRGWRYNWRAWRMISRRGRTMAGGSPLTKGSLGICVFLLAECDVGHPGGGVVDVLFEVVLVIWGGVGCVKPA